MGSVSFPLIRDSSFLSVGILSFVCAIIGSVWIMSTRTVEFDVGGTVFKVSKSLLEQHPDTMLARMASDTWNKSENDEASNESKPLFIERNGSRFQFVLDYMRDGKVSLRVFQEVTKESVLQELEYYGFVNIDPDCVNVVLMEEEVGKLTVSAKNQFQNALILQRQGAMRYFCMTLAQKCYLHWHHSTTVKRQTTPVSADISLIKDGGRDRNSDQVVLQR